MPQRINVPLLKRLVKSAPPETEQEIADAELTGLLVKHLPSGSIRFYSQVARGRRETIAHAQGSGRRAVKRVGEGTLYPIDANDVLDRHKPDISLTWVRKECLRLQGTTLDGTDRGAARQAQRSIPTLRDFLDETAEGSYGWWVIHNRKTGRATLARVVHCFLKPYGNAKLDQLTPSALHAWRTKRLKGIGMRKASRETCNRDTGALKAVLSKAVEWDILKTHPLANFKPAKVDRNRRAIRRLHDDEVEALRKALEAREDRLRDERRSGNDWREQRGYTLLPSLDGIYVDALRPAVELSLATGMRKGECFELTWKIVDLKNRVIRLPGEVTKSYTSRDIPLNDRVLTVLRKWKMQRGRSRGYVFAGSSGHLTTLKKAFTKVLDAAGIACVTGEGRVTWHSLRHSFGSRLGDAGVPAGTIRELMGHANLATTQRYLQPSEESKQAAVEALG
jgi:integrase